MKRTMTVIDQEASPRQRLSRRLPARRDRVLLTVGAIVLAVVVIASGLLLYPAVRPSRQITAYFAETIGVYPGSTVRILGVPVGTVDSVTPDGTQVKVVMTIDHGVPVPADAGAVVIAPSVVADRYIQLTPAWTHGPQLASGAVIPVTRTAIPLEVDQVYASLDKLAAALGPNGANKHGALSTLIKTGAANLAGNGAYLRQMLTEFSGLSKTLGGSAGNLFASISYLQQFTTMLKDNNAQVKQAETQLADVSSFLAADRQDLAAALRDLATALNQVKTFIGGNRALIDSNVNNLASVTTILSQERASLAEALDDAPLAADNLVNAYDVTRHTLDGRGDLNEFDLGAAARQSFTTGDSSMEGLFGPLGSVPLTSAQDHFAPPLPLPVTGTEYGSPEAAQAGGGR
jgi:phospholipid/cholesterol/gamma-HCH transport system substrate-binding protein